MLKIFRKLTSKGHEESTHKPDTGIQNNRLVYSGDLLPYGIKEIIDSYEVNPFSVTIYSSSSGVRYYTSKFCGTASDLQLVGRSLDMLDSEHPVPETIPSNLDQYMKWFMSLVSPYLAGAKDRAESIARYAAYEWIGLGRLYTVFEDPAVDEFFSDSNFSYPYVEHRRVGRCQLTFMLQKREQDSLRTFAELYGQQQATLQTPSVKSELMFDRFKVRIGLDLEPVSVNGPSIHMRKVGAEALTLPKLIRDGAVTLEAASLILAAAYSRISITILGPSGSGKTTLLNAIDLAIDPRLRRIYIEDAVESLELSELGYRQTKLRVQPLESGDDAERSKMKEVLKTLHRSPDIVILGEIQDRLQCSALFQALESGIVCLQTFHASSPEQAVRRLVNVMGIRPEQLNDIGLIVTMKRPDQLSSARIVNRISEVDESMTVRDIHCRQESRAEITHALEPSERLLQKATDLTDHNFNALRVKMVDLLLTAMEKDAYDVSTFANLVWKKVCSDEG
ncbi:MAG: ATPase, T2SS/T4P/T4SS family [Conexivisphaerales archaeon]